MLNAPFTVAKANARLMNFFDVKRTLIDSLNSVCYTMALRLKLIIKTTLEGLQVFMRRKTD